jgi:hypothetical protein
MLSDWYLVLAAYNIGKYGLVRDMKFFNASDVSEMISRNTIPKETQNEEIKKLNPVLSTWCTPYGYPNFELRFRTEVEKYL